MWITTLATTGLFMRKPFFSNTKKCPPVLRAKAVVLPGKRSGYLVKVGKVKVKTVKGVLSGKLHVHNLLFNLNGAT